MKPKSTSHLNSIENNLLSASRHIHTNYYLSSENNFLLYTQNCSVYSANVIIGRKWAVRQMSEGQWQEEIQLLKKKKERLARTGMCMQRSGVGRKQKEINQLKWKTAANYNTGTNRESWMSGKGEAKIIFLLFSLKLQVSGYSPLWM